MSVKKVSLAILLVLGVIFLTVFLNNKEERYATAEEREVNTLVYGSGYARNKEYVLLKSEVSGYVNSVFVKEGDYVKKGQVLASIHSGSIDESIREVSERLNLVKERSKQGSAYLSSLESATESAKINMENAKKLYERRERLFSQGLISKETYEQSKLQYETAQKEYERAKKTYEDAVVSLNFEERALLAQRQRLMAEREKYTIKSPVEGHILKKFVNQGDYINHVSQENKLFSIGSRGWEVWLEVDEEYTGLINEGQKVYLNVDALPGKSFEGRVSQVIRELDRTRKLITVRVDAELPFEIPSGATVDGRIEVEKRRALVIPVLAYSDGYVTVYRNGKKVKVQVKAGRVYGEFIEIKEGLRPGDRVLLP
ncbi:MAG: efflux RND transporter periplasmic adaptor subunit [Aquificaceae bacterium]|nr:efflux RND transporter periplasmic adaptor subunit [Aquificaceae bacterium]